MENLSYITPNKLHVYKTMTISAVSSSNRLKNNMLINELMNKGLLIKNYNIVIKSCEDMKRNW